MNRIKHLRRVLSGLGMCCLLFPFGQHAQAQSGADSLEQLLGTALGCELVGELMADMPTEPLYQLDEGSAVCEAVDPRTVNTGNFFADSNCSESVNYARTPMFTYCQSATDKTNFGGGVGASDSLWSHSPGSRLDLGARSLQSVGHPYVQRVIYRTVTTAGGQCDLEMRIYKSHPSATGQTPMIALHGGSWSARGFGFFGLELTAPHFVEQGFVVYAPFYRLLDSKESSAACHNSNIVDIASDAQAALTWVEQNQSTYGSTGKPVVFGQSAGGHLSLSLAVNSPTQISGAVLMYPPTDFTDFVDRAQQGYYTNEGGIAIVDDVLGMSVDSADTSQSPIPENSFPQRVANDPAMFPPMMIVHGLADELVEARQSVRLCDALASRALLPTDQEIEEQLELRTINDCGTGSSGVASNLHLILQGKHALDVCIDDGLLSDSTCPAGNADSRALVSDTIAAAVGFSKSAAAAGNESEGETDGGMPDGDGDGGGSGGGGVAWFLCLILIFRHAIRHQIVSTKV